MKPRLSHLSLFFVLASCQHTQPQAPSRWQVDYSGTDASVNYADDGGATTAQAVDTLADCSTSAQGLVTCVGDGGMSVEFTPQSTTARLWGKSSGESTPAGIVTLTCRSPFVAGQAVTCDQGR